EQRRGVLVYSAATPRIRLREVKSAAEVAGVRHSPPACERRKSGKDDKQQDHNLEDTQHVDEPHAPLLKHDVQPNRERRARDTNAARHVPVALGAPGSIEDVAAEG